MSRLDPVDDTDETASDRGCVGFVDVSDGRQAEDRVPRRELVTLLAYLETGSHKAGAHGLGISESTSRQRMSSLIRRVGARNAAQAVWALREKLERDVVV